ELETRRVQRRSPRVALDHVDLRPERQHRGGIAPLGLVLVLDELLLGTREGCDQQRGDERDDQLGAPVVHTNPLAVRKVLPASCVTPRLAPASPRCTTGLTQARRALHRRATGRGAPPANGRRSPTIADTERARPASDSRPTGPIRSQRRRRLSALSVARLRPAGCPLPPKEPPEQAVRAGTTSAARQLASSRSSLQCNTPVMRQRGKVQAPSEPLVQLTSRGPRQLRQRV